MLVQTLPIGGRALDGLCLLKIAQSPRVDSAALHVESGVGANQNGREGRRLSWKLLPNKDGVG
jgi:hypothetical protein